MIGRLNHVAIAVPDLDAAAAQYRGALGADVGPPLDQPDHGVTVIFITLPNTKIELLYPLGKDLSLKPTPNPRGQQKTRMPASAWKKKKTTQQLYHVPVVT